MLSRISNFLKSQRNLFSSCSQYNLTCLGIEKPSTIYHNLSSDELLTHEIENKEGVVFKTKYGKTFGVDTGKFTGRSPKDKWIVKNLDSESNQNLWWGEVNKPTTPEVFEEILDKAVNHFNTLEDIYLRLTDDT